MVRVRESGVAEKHVRLVQDMNESSTDGSDGWFQGGGRTASKISSDPLIVCNVMDRLTGEVRQESPWTVMFFRWHWDL